jgi:hypothetical protein
VGDDAMGAPLGIVLLLGVVLMGGAAAFVIATGFHADDAPPLAFALRSEACATVGRWTVARLGVAAGHVAPAALAASQATPGRPLAVQALDAAADAGESIWVVTPAGQADALRCGSPLLVTDPARNALVASVPTQPGEAHPLAVGATTCDAAARRTSVTLTLARVPPGLRAKDLQVVDLDSGASTGAGGDLRISPTGARVLVAGDVVTVRTPRDAQDLLACSDAIALVDKVSGATLREARLAPS